MHGAGIADDRRHANDAYTKAASDERDKRLNSQIKSIYPWLLRAIEHPGANRRPSAESFMKVCKINQDQQPPIIVAAVASFQWYRQHLRSAWLFIRVCFPQISCGPLT
jgi:hypothetical protein